MVSDPIADFLNRLKTASAVRKESVVIPYSKLKHAIASVLKDEGYLSSVQKKGRKAKKNLEIQLTYNEDGTPKIESLRRWSRPSRRRYLGAGDIRPVKHGRGTLVISTPKGVLTGEGARKENVGGEPLFEIR